MLLLLLLAFGTIAAQRASFRQADFLRSADGLRIDSWIGYHDDYKESERLALQQLAEEIHRYPKANVYTVDYPISRILWFTDDSNTVYYDRHEMQLSRGNSCGCGTWWSPVTEDIIRTVVSRHQTLDDLEKYGCEAGP